MNKAPEGNKELLLEEDITKRSKFLTPGELSAEINELIPVQKL